MGEQESSTQVNVKLPLSQKRNWEQYVEGNEEATSLSHLIRLAVEREIGESQPSNQSGIDPDEMDLTVDLEPVEQRLNQIENTLDRFIDVVEAIETEQIADEDEIEQIADEIYDTMPRIYGERDGVQMSPEDMAYAELIEYIDHQLEEQGKSIRELVQNENFHGLVEAYQRYFDADNYTMQKALDRVEQYSARVHVVDDWEYTVVFEINEEVANL